MAVERRPPVSGGGCQALFCDVGSDANVPPAQRLALPASGRDETRLESRINPKPEKSSKNAQNPTCRVHAVLGGSLNLKVVYHS